MNTEIKKTIKNEKGFTLVELIVVIAILAILAAVAVPSYVNYQYRAMVSTDVSTCAEILRAARMFEIENGTVATTADISGDISVLQGAGATGAGWASGDAAISGWGQDANGNYELTFKPGAKAKGYQKAVTISEAGNLPKAKDFKGA